MFLFGEGVGIWGLGFRVWPFGCEDLGLLGLGGILVYEELMGSDGY